MKKIIILFLLVLPISLLAQEKSGYGVKLGVSASSIKLSHRKFRKSFSTYVSPAVGFVANAIITKKFRIYTDISVTSIGGEYTDTATVGANYYNDPKGHIVTGTDKLRCINFQYFLLGEYRITEKIFVKGGPVINFIMSRRISGSSIFSTDETVTAGARAVLASESNPLNAGLTIGAGFSHKKFRFDLIYIAGLTNLLDKEELESELSIRDFKSANCNFVQLTAAYFFK